MKQLQIISILLIAVSCNKEQSQIEKLGLGKVDYYPSFLWSKEGVFFLEKTLELDFNPDAKGDPETFAEFIFTDNDGNRINDLEIYVDEKILNNNKLRAQSNEREKKLKFSFSPTAHSGKHQGYLQLTSHKLDRLNNTILFPGEKMNVLQWTIYFNKKMNPLAKLFLWISIGIIVFLTVWFVLLRPIFYPRFGSIQKTFNVPGMAPLIIRFKGARKVIISSEPKKQGFWDALIKGSVLYKRHPAVTSPIIMRPVSGRRIFVKADSSVYRISPNPMPSVGAATIDNVRSNMHITIN